jgi:hypothetical protein
MLEYLVFETFYNVQGNLQQKLKLETGYQTTSVAIALRAPAKLIAAINYTRHRQSCLDKTKTNINCSFVHFAQILDLHINDIVNHHDWSGFLEKVEYFQLQDECENLDAYSCQ